MNKALLPLILLSLSLTAADTKRPNILFCIADDWGWPHAGAYANDTVLKTPAFDSIAKEGVIFEHAYVSSPSCTPSRNAILTGQYHWRLGSGACLHSTLPEELNTYPQLLEDSGYHTGHWRKSWGPGKLKGKWAQRHPAGTRYKNFPDFLDSLPQGEPFCFWLGASDPHRPYDSGSGVEKGMDLSKIKLFSHYPDSDVIRSDVADYYFEVERFDNDVAEAINLLVEKGLRENTVIVITGDHGMPFPRCKSNLYDSGTRVPLAISWPKKYKGNRSVSDFVSTVDLAPTFLDLAGIRIPSEMSGRSLVPILQSHEDGNIEGKKRSYAITGKERHVPSQEAPDSGGYPSRALRTEEFLIIRNYEADRWPNGTPHYNRAHIPGAWYSDTDNGPSKSYIVENKNKDEEHREAYERCFAKRPEYELYVIKDDPDQLNNVAENPEYAGSLKKLQAKLERSLKTHGDPRATGAAQSWDTQPYTGGAPKAPGLDKPKKGK